MLTAFMPGKSSDNTGKIEAISRSMAVIEFEMDGTIIDANENFLKTVGYSLADIVGKHHRMFMDPKAAESAEYRKLWADLANGEFKRGTFRRLGRGGREIYLEASYNPIIGSNGRPTRIIKFAADVTASTLERLNLKATSDAVNHSMATIEFTLDGKVVTANQNFLKAMGYTLNEIVGQHHRMFVPNAIASSGDYQKFWASLNRGEYQAAEFQRIGKGGRVVYLQASYNPVYDIDGKLCRVIKIGQDVTSFTERRQSFEAATRDIAGTLDHIAAGMSAANAKASEVSQGSAETASTVQTVAASAEELSASIREIATNIGASRRAVEVAAQRTQEANGTTAALAASAQSMTNIVGMIQSIASQINLLALNATIESARAGEAGRGFAVVAGEVKNLAQQVSKATDTVSDEIKKLQDVSGGVVSTLAQITESMNALMGNVSAVATAVEQQTAVTNDISANMQAASTAVTGMDRGLGEIASSVRGANDWVTSIKQNVSQLIA